MRITTIAAAVALAVAPALLSAQMRSSSAAPETTYVKGSVMGELPTGNYVITSSRTVYLTTPAPTPNVSVTVEETTSETPSKPPLDKKISHGVREAGGEASKLGKKAAHGAGEAAGDVSKLGKKAAHGVKNAASDVKKKVTGKP
jgi:hypothetical protein